MGAVTGQYRDGELSRQSSTQEPDLRVTEEDAKDPAKVARILTSTVKDIETLKRRVGGNAVEFVDVWCPGDGKPIRLGHHLGGRVRVHVSSWRAPGPDLSFASACLWVRRPFFGPMTLLNAAGNFTLACYFRVDVRSLVSGVRFAWKSPGAAATVTVKLWNVVTGVQVASGTVSVNESGVYNGHFDKPFLIDGSDIGAQFAVSYYNGASYSYTAADAAFEALLPMQMPGVHLDSIIKYAAGDAFPNLDAVVSRHWAEPIFCDPNPELVEDTANTTEDVVALRSFSPGFATILVEPLP